MLRNIIDYGKDKIFDEYIKNVFPSYVAGARCVGIKPVDIETKKKAHNVMERMFPAIYSALGLAGITMIPFMHPIG